MGTSSSLPAVKAQLVSLLSTALASSGVSGGAVPVEYAWVPDATDEMVFLGRALLDPTDRDEIDIAYAPTVAEAPRPLSETYSVPVSVWSFRPDLSPSAAQEAEERIGVLVGVLLAALLDNPRPVTGVRLSAIPERAVARRVPFQSGWACFTVVDVAVVATIT